MPVATLEVTVRACFVALHCWPGAPLGVSFLRNKHRHEFHVELSIAVEHDDRDIEFCLLKQALDQRLRGYPEDIGEKSCEMLAHETIAWARGRHPDRKSYRCSVFEDGENGATVAFVGV